MLITPLYAIGAAGIAVGLFLVADIIGDRREAKVRDELEPQITQARVERDQWKAAHHVLLEDAKRADANSREKLKGAIAARDAAGRFERERPDGVQPNPTK